MLDGVLPSVVGGEVAHEDDRAAWYAERAGLKRVGAAGTGVLAHRGDFAAGDLLHCLGPPDTGAEAAQRRSGVLPEAGEPAHLDLEWLAVCRGHMDSAADPYRISAALKRQRDVVRCHFLVHVKPVQFQR